MSCGFVWVLWTTRLGGSGETAGFRLTGRDWVLVGVAVVVGLALVGSQLPDEKPSGGSVPAVTVDDSGVVENDPSSRPGSQAVYARIEGSSDCVALQREFDVAMSNAEAREPGDRARDIALSYADAADNQMQESGCYG